MTVVGFHASHEQIHPGDLLDAVRLAEECGFDTAMCSDHFAPWGRDQGHSGYAWAWLGAALASTGLTYGTVCAPGQRYHPAVVAQKIATLAAMFPGRVWTALGSGENVNEHVTGDPWPSKSERDARLRECVEVIRALLAGEEVTHHGLVTVDRARVWTLPEEPPQLILPVIGPEAAAMHADWADGLITTNQPREQLRRVVGAYRDAGGRGEVSFQVHLSWASTVEEAERLAVEQWRTNAAGPPATWDLPLPSDFDALAEGVGAEQIRGSVFVCADVDAAVDYLASLVDLGDGVRADRLYLHHVGQRQDEFVKTFGEQVLPRLKEAVTPPEAHRA
ncbi:TIGR03885 family FMN-dependent LLM class oxidoreductase [Antribacter gilvus]|uniref:TIGR03885 family FMN-dependent LLM class oxidoreductase n=1 Tax=Antribacter gilvus TaxID=2304675 RepID=UPI000F7725F5|nr:TIGR03885 family FMN-dependent LLM class oxidoreductase [Antribacter gilvus]